MFCALLLGYLEFNLVIKKKGSEIYSDEKRSDLTYDQTRCIISDTITRYVSDNPTKSMGYLKGINLDSQFYGKVRTFYNT